MAMNKKDILEGDDINVKNLQMIMFIRDLPPINKRDINDLKHRFNLCLEYCFNNNIKLTNRTAYLFMSLTTEDVHDIDLKCNGFNNDIYIFIQNVKNICAQSREYLMAEGQIHPAVGIFWQKAYDGYQDTPQININNINVLPNVSKDELLEQYGAAALVEGKEVDF